MRALIVKTTKENENARKIDGNGVFEKGEEKLWMAWIQPAQLMPKEFRRPTTYVTQRRTKKRRKKQMTEWHMKWNFAGENKRTREWTSAHQQPLTFKPSGYWLQFVHGMYTNSIFFIDLLTNVMLFVIWGTAHFIGYAIVFDSIHKSPHPILATLNFHFNWIFYSS